jgi:hypothetical protein
MKTQLEIVSESNFNIKFPKYIGKWDLNPVFSDVFVHTIKHPSTWVRFFMWFFFRVTYKRL